MTWEITRNKNGMVIAEHARRSDNHKPASAGERCRLTETRPGFLGIDYMPGRTGVTVPATEDYQELADITQRVVTVGHIEEPFRPLEP